MILQTPPDGDALIAAELDGDAEVPLAETEPEEAEDLDLAA